PDQSRILRMGCAPAGELSWIRLAAALRARRGLALDLCGDRQSDRALLARHGVQRRELRRPDRLSDRGEMDPDRQVEGRRQPALEPALFPLLARQDAR